MWALLGLLACGDASGDFDDTDTDGNGTDDTDTSRSGTEVAGKSRIYRDCAPNDGAALVLAPAQPDDTCSLALDADRAGLGVWIYLYGDLPGITGGTVAFDAQNNNASAQYCSDATSGTCVGAVSGEVDFRGFVDGVSASGTWTLTLADGNIIYGSFDADWCEADVVCG